MGAIKTAIDNISKGTEVGQNAAKIYGMLITELKKDDQTLLSAQVQGDGKITVEKLLEVMYTDVKVADSADKEKANLQTAQQKIDEFRKALDKYISTAATLNTTLSGATKGAALTNKVNISNDADIKTAYDKLTTSITAAGFNVNANKITDLKGTVVASAEKADDIANNKLDTAPAVKEDQKANLDLVKLEELLTKYNKENIEATQAEIDKFHAMINDLQALQKVIQVKTTKATFKEEFAKADSGVFKDSVTAKTLNEAGLVDLISDKIDYTTPAAGDIDSKSIAADIEAQVVKPMQQATNEAAVATSSPIGALTVLNHASSINTATRLAKLSGFDANNMALASAIKNMDGIELASGDTSALSSIVKEYTDRFNYDNSVWANFIGAKGNTNNGNPELYGFSVGYDRSLDNAIVGGYFTYANSKVDTANLENEADNFEFGLYSRIFYGQNEFDLGASYGFGNNDITYSNYNRVVNALLSGSTDYDSKFINLNASYGYVLKAGDTIFVKPFIGLGYTYSSNDDYTLNKVNFKSVDTNVVYADLGVELRKYLNDGSYVFITPAIEQELSRNSDDTIASFVGANSAFLTNPADEKEQTYAKLTVGGEYAISKSLSTTLTLGYKGNTDNTLVNGSLGVKYKF
ncbi:autotransporter outer membrane beta-barrel domain-containing protein [Campylobacter hyointestinalis]|uniref:Autotransporter outer membrane beta-barrel domain-containing protein n=1 Tax=Campylobacter hyointestinalis TaxID=198 RepID=A0A562XCB7_CAMHY|nr:autotransporter domain-containing protein [Campylobacter hyointestinalis]TWO19782.1 autotransporter outer membrane beta-barrel domain-containing protein [Campylobacter hyointestinalis]